MPQGKHSLYIYYRVEPARLVAAREGVQTLMGAVRDRSGVQGRWLAKIDDPSLWMEVYEGIDDLVAFESQVLECASHVQFDRFLTPGSQRHSERFAPCA